MKIYKIKVSYTFTGVVEVRASNKSSAKIIANCDFGMVAGQFNCSNESNDKETEGVTNWNFDTHPSKRSVS